MVRKIKAVSLVTVKIGDQRLVWRFSGTGGPGSFPFVALPSLSSFHGRGSFLLHPHSRLRKGKRGGEGGTGLSFEGKDPEVTHLINIHFPLSRIKSYDHISL